MSYRVRFTKSARNDLLRLYEFLVARDLVAADKAMGAIEKGMALLREFPFTCRKPVQTNPFWRELVISFGTSGYVLLYEIEDHETVTILAVRHQREDDFH